MEHAMRQVDSRFRVWAWGQSGNVRHRQYTQLSKQLSSYEKEEIEQCETMTGCRLKCSKRCLGARVVRTQLLFVLTLRNVSLPIHCRQLIANDQQTVTSRWRTGLSTNEIHMKRMSSGQIFNHVTFTGCENVIDFNLRQRVCNQQK